MPIPTPYPDETRDRFLARCEAFLHKNDSYLGTNQVYALGAAQWERSRKQSTTKADTELPTPNPAVPGATKDPQWLRYSLLLRKLIREAWDESSADWADKLLQKIQEADVEGARKTLQSGLSPLKKRFKKALGDKVGILVDLAFKKSNAYWKKYALDWIANAPKEKGDVSGNESRFITKAVESPDDAYQERIRALHAEQIKQLAIAYPEHILAPEIERLISLMADYEIAREIDIAYIAERANKFLAADTYWSQFTDVHIGRMWHSDGIAFANANKVGRLQIVAILDEVTCGVCLVMHGQEVDVKQAQVKVDKDLDIKNIDDYIDAWKFPRFNEVQLLGPEEITKAGYLVPFHPHCRCSQMWLY
jgi:hypothetical protein